MSSLCKTTFKADGYELELHINVIRKLDASVSEPPAEIDVGALKQRLSPLPFVARYSPQPYVEPFQDRDYYMDMVVLEADDVLFQVPIAHLDGAKIPGLPSRSLTPVSLDNVRVRHLTNFLAVINWQLSPKTSNMYLSFEDWLQVHKMSREWSCKNIRDLAERAIDSFTLSYLEKLRYGREFQIELLLSHTYLDIITRTETVRVDEANALGMAALVKLMECRQELRAEYQPPLGGETNLRLREKSRDALRKVIGAPDSLTDNDQSSPDDFVRRVQIAEREGILEWVVDAYSDFIKRSENLTLVEAKLLGIETSAAIYRAREYYKEAIVKPFRDKSLALTKSIKSGLDGHSSKPESAGVIGRISLATHYGFVAREWKLQASHELIERESPINLYEARVLGMGDFVDICRARDRYLKSLQRRTPAYPKEQRHVIAQAKVKLLLKDAVSAES